MESELRSLIARENRFAQLVKDRGYNCQGRSRNGKLAFITDKGNRLYFDSFEDAYNHIGLLQD
jgi:hypothetical protein